MTAKEVVVVSACRTPFGKYLGALKDIPLVDLGVIPVKEVLQRVNLGSDVVDCAFTGNCLSSEAETPNVVGRQISLKAGIPPEVYTGTVDTACCSALFATRLAYQAVKYGEAQVAIGGGVEAMSRAPLLVPPNVRWGTKIGPIVLNDFIFGLDFKGYNPVSVDAGNVALEYGVAREEQDQWAVRSQQLYAGALAQGKFENEIVPVTLPKKGAMTQDEQPRPDTTLEKLAKLPTVFGSPTITAGNAPGLNDGAAYMLLMTREKADEWGLEPLATVVAGLGRSTSPHYIATIPGIIIGEILAKNGLSMDDISLIEINEAFAAMPLVSSIVLADGDRQKAERIREKINVNGGAVAIGHPVGASGARILMTMIYELRRRGGGYGVSAICGGLAQGEAMLIKV
jgi:acetyl-CoA C-acetyltransferase